MDAACRSGKYGIDPRHDDLPLASRQGVADRVWTGASRECLPAGNQAILLIRQGRDPWNLHSVTM